VNTLHIVLALQAPRANTVRVPLVTYTVGAWVGNGVTEPSLACASPSNTKKSLSLRLSDERSARAHDRAAAPAGPAMTASSVRALGWIQASQLSTSPPT